jgi:peptidoglycan/LPS O-acetylase OafA/YrhL
MNKPFSIYLDLLRLVAACVVFGHHLDFATFGGVDSIFQREESTHLPFAIGHKVVVVFFVLSGYVITYVACERERGLSEFVLARVARIYSVALPAVALTICIDLSLIAAGKSQHIPLYQYAGFWKYLPLSLLFMNQLWFLNEGTFSDGAFWSLCYEVWYYALFAALFYGQGLGRWLLGGAIALVMGPKLWALFPIWALGAIAYKLGGRMQIGVVRARWLLGCSTVVLIVVVAFDVLNGLDSWADGLSGQWISTHLGLSQWFVGDTLIGALCAINMHAARFARPGFGAYAAPIRLLASYSFTLYLAHGPLLEFWSWHFGLGKLSLLVVVSFCVVVLGMFTEHQKDRIRRWLGRWLALALA